MKVLLDGLLPRLLPAELPYLLIPHEGKSDLIKSIPRKLRAWSDPDVRFVVVCDQNSSDCHALKQQLAALCAAGGRADSLVRIACRELEAWLLGDLGAVEQGLGVTGLVGLERRAPYRNPDLITSPSRRLADLVPGYQKVHGARVIGPILDPSFNRSQSFQVFVEGLRRVSTAR